MKKAIAVAVLVVAFIVAGFVAQAGANTSWTGTHPTGGNGTAVP